MERRQILELRTSGRRLEGCVVKFGVEARVAGFVETVRPGAFARSLASARDVRALIDHDMGKLLGRTSSGTLRLREDAAGLQFELDVPDTTLGRDILALAERRDLSGMSFGFLVPKDGESWQGNRRILTAVDLHEISVVTGAVPAYPQTDVIPRTATPRLNLALRFLETVR